MKITHDNGYGTVYEFEVVNKAPAEYAVWNIGDCLGGYIPFCVLVPTENEWERLVDITKLLAVKVDNDEYRKEVMYNLAPYGVGNLKKARKALAGAKRASEREGLALAVEIYEKIQEE